ncbi:hypothetical protein [Aquimarina algiphila]|uniref:hypothetical protein n=1 Tax=Aquimarina algiphila TaxID=2047982 RepID=UPI0024912AC3|nr:hypothetical protein [Aquimarina algiphila]
MKNKKVNLGKLSLNKMTISSLEQVQGGRLFASGDGCDSKDNLCNSQSTKFTRIEKCCSGETTIKNCNNE